MLAVALFVLFTLESIVPLRSMRSGRIVHAGRNLIWVGTALLTNAFLASLLVTTATSLATQHGWGLLPVLGLDGAKTRLKTLVGEAEQALAPFGRDGEVLKMAARFVAERKA